MQKPNAAKKKVDYIYNKLMENYKKQDKKNQKKDKRNKRKREKRKQWKIMNYRAEHMKL